MLKGAALALLIAAAPARDIAAQPEIEVVAKRFLHGAGATLIDGFCRIPLALFQPAPSQDAAYSIEVAVRDTSGLVLHESSWSQSVAAPMLALTSASTVEHFVFAVPDGKYTVTVTVVDSASGRVKRASASVAALDDPYASDLLLSPSMRRASADAVAGPGELQKGSLFLVSTTQPVLTPREPSIFYYLELYPSAEATVELTTRVLTADGTPITATAPEQIELPAGGGVTARELNLAGLPPGDYRLELAVRFPDRRVTREAPFTMAGFDTEAALAAAAPREARDPFGALTRQQLDSVYWPLEQIMERSERGIFESLSDEGKRNYLREFWAKRDPTPATPVNEEQIGYYRRVAEATRRFRESGAGDVPGWSTPRGRIFLKLGEPEEVLKRPQSGSTMPFEVWKYSRPRDLKYVFLDETGLGNYALIYTNDRFEIGRADWESLLSAEALLDIRRF